MGYRDWLTLNTQMASKPSWDLRRINFPTRCPFLTLYRPYGADDVVEQITTTGTTTTRLSQVWVTCLWPNPWVMPLATPIFHRNKSSRHCDNSNNASDIFEHFSSKDPVLKEVLQFPLWEHTCTEVTNGLHPHSKFFHGWVHLKQHVLS